MRSSNDLYLLNDSGSALQGPVTPGSNATLSNSQCALNAMTSSVNSSGNNLTENVSLTFAAGFTGLKYNYGYVQNNGGQNSGFMQLGTWTLPVAGSPPTVTSIAPGSGSGLGPAVFTYTYGDTNGYSDISYVYSMLSANGSGVNSCFVAFFPKSNAFYLLNDAGNQLQGPITGGTNTTLSNSQCMLNASGSGSSGSANSLTVNVSLSFQAGFAGQKSNYGFVANTNGQNSGYQNKGTWNP